MTRPKGTYTPSPKRAGEEQTGYAVRLMQEECYFNARRFIAAMLREKPQDCPWGEDCNHQHKWDCAAALIDQADDLAPRPSALSGDAA